MSNQPTTREALDAFITIAAFRRVDPETATKRSQRDAWQAAKVIQYYGLKWEVHLNALTMNEPAWRSWMDKKFPQKGKHLGYMIAKTLVWNIHSILPAETDF